MSASVIRWKRERRAPVPARPHWQVPCKVRPESMGSRHISDAMRAERGGTLADSLAKRAAPPYQPRRVWPFPMRLALLLCGVLAVLAMGAAHG